MKSLNVFSYLQKKIRHIKKKKNARREAQAGVCSGSSSSPQTCAPQTCLLSPAYSCDSPACSSAASAYVSIRQHTSACVSMRQHASAYVSIDSVVQGQLRVSGVPVEMERRVKRQYLYFCTGSCVSICTFVLANLEEISLEEREKERERERE